MPTMYLVKNTKTGDKAFVKASSKQAAILAMTQGDHTAEVASKDHLTEMLPMGVPIIDPSKKTTEPAADNPGGDQQP